jgi:subtilisin-like proprotein convertase family protein
LDFATRPEADIDLYVARGPNAWGLTNLDPVIVAGADKSLGRNGTEMIIYSNAQPDEVFYIGVKAEDQEAAEYGFLGLFSQFPFSERGPNGELYVRGLNLPTPIPDGTPEKPGIARTMALAVGEIKVRRVVVTNVMEHENFGDLFGSLVHNRKSSVLNNHTFGNGNFLQQFVYEDNDEGDVPGSQHTDHPGTLKNFIGEEGLGLWMLAEVDNAFNHTGRVDNLRIRLDPQQDTNGVVATIQPNTFFFDFIDVPPEATNLTICVSYDPQSGVGLPVITFVRFGELPTTNSFDYVHTNNPPGSCFTIDRTSIPRLKPGRYYVGIFNPNSVAQTIRLTWTFGLDINGIEPVIIGSTNSPLLIDDAVTNNTVTITTNQIASADQKIAAVNVGVVLQHPRVSDLDITLISPDGQRILLFENRGGPSATNMGHLNIQTNFFGTTTAGGANANTNILGPVPATGVLVIDYDFFIVPDQIDVYDGDPSVNGIDIFHSGFIRGAGTFSIPYNLVNGGLIYIVMNQGNNPRDTAWVYTPRIVAEDFTYLTFTDDTNLTQMPIKFAIPPYDNQDNGTNFTISDFELATNGDYLANFATPSNNIHDLNGGWIMTTNDILLGTNLLGGTNVLSMATNLVSVVTDSNNAAAGTNFLALARGSISRVLSVVPQRKYTLTYLYRGPGIAGWWRGENDATDSADPETLGNNGQLIGRFNFPAGEVGQAFALEDSGLAFQFAGTNTYVQVRQSPSLDVGPGGGFTVEGWINPTNVTFKQPVVEWLAHVPTNNTINGQSVTNMVIEAGPFLNRANGHYYYLLGSTNWRRSELWAEALGGHLAEVDDANEENWIYDTFAQFGGTNHTMWIGLTNVASPGFNFGWSTGSSNVAYTNWAGGQPTNCGPGFVAILGPTNALPGLWTILNNAGLTCTLDTNICFGVAEVNEIQTNGVQLWISVTNDTTPGLGRIYANIMDTNSVPHELFSPPGLIQTNVYQHIALTFNTNTGVAALYYNGTNVASTNLYQISTNLGFFVPKTGGDVLLGKDMSRITNNFFWGKLDEMSIYSRFLSGAEIFAIYNVSASTTNRNVGKFDPRITPSESLAEVQASFGDITNILFGAGRGWQVQGFTFRASSNSLPIQFTGLEPGVLLDSFNLSQQSLGNLYYLPEQALDVLVGSNALGAWTLEIRDARTGAISTNANLISWQLQFVLQSNTPVPIPLSPQMPATNTVPPGDIAYFTVNVPSWASWATNRLVSSSAPVDLLFNQTALPGTGAPGDFTLLANSLGGIGNPVLFTNGVTSSTPPLLRGQTYTLGVRNNSGTPATFSVEVDFDIVTLTNGSPFTSVFGTNDVERPFVFNVTTNASEATFELLQLTG